MGNITELKQGSLNGLRRQTNECLESAYNKGYEDGKKEPREVKALNVEDTCEYQIGYKVGFEDGKKQAISEMPEVANKENEMYDRGVEDLSKAIAWYSILKHSERVKYLGKNLAIYGLIEDTPQKLIEGFKAYEEKKQAEEFKVGDIVKFNKNCHDYENKKNREFLVLHKFDNGIVTLLYDNGDTGAADISLLDKTGRHIDETEQLLDKLKGDK